MKICKRCQKSKEFALFGKSKRYSDGFWPYCKTCECQRVAEYRAKNPEKVKTTLAASREKCADRIAATKRKYRLNNPEKVKLARKIAYEAKRDTELAKAREYKKLNPHVTRSSVANRVARKKDATPSWFDRERVLDLHRQAVELNELTGMIWHVDHIVPLKSPLVCGLHWHENMQLLPASVNQSKSNRHWPDMP